jgi:hypothetical protein
MSAQRIKKAIDYAGGAVTLLAAGWAVYLDISSNGQDPFVMRWFAAALGLAVLTWGIGRIVAKYGDDQSGAPPPNSN